MNFNNDADEPVRAAWTYLSDLAQHDPPLLKTNFYYTNRVPKLGLDDDTESALPPSHAAAWNVVVNLAALAAMRGPPAIAELADGTGDERQTTIVPGDSLVFLDNWAPALCFELSTDLKCIDPNDGIELSHLSIDSLYDASSLVPSTSTLRKDVIATLVVLLAPMDAREINLKLVQAGVAVPWREANTNAVHYALVPTEASLVASAVPAQGAPPRVALIFRVVRSSAHTARGLAMIDRGALYLEKLAPISALGNRSGIQVGRRDQLPDLEALPVLLRAFLDALLGSNCYDIGLAEYSQETGIQLLGMHEQSSPVKQRDFLNVVLDEYVLTDDNEQPTSSTS
ncbi:hypothetical protein SDRG_11095 [Saprolegnia diclina VS20]|uniref:Uncharacterized protein n=1 Tax=Saprolegnia diclina (strain VS20) TaxID=1156394 RepID=T0RFV5_SAPDV|nr:hypothetical protein SDRG_11095 [Saprolegnia diclina VS20]EQC31168.1 hypothetical protein SDRG_11095 [Saprolegnia diclina VS20]|eukprot:XP_008615341.1 hypothetical protein SDRG_11095 [Saprolegnia diclina VS20]